MTSRTFTKRAHIASTDVWMSTAEASEALGLTVRTLYRFIDDGKLPAYRFGRVFRLKKADIETFVESCKVSPGDLAHLVTFPADGEE